MTGCRPLFTNSSWHQVAFLIMGSDIQLAILHWTYYPSLSSQQVGARILLPQMQKSPKGVQPRPGQIKHFLSSPHQCYILFELIPKSRCHIQTTWFHQLFLLTYCSFSELQNLKSQYPGGQFWLLWFPMTKLFFFNSLLFKSGFLCVVPAVLDRPDWP